MLFGDYLRQLLARESIAPIDLAGSLAVDISLVYRWLRHERVPGANSSYVAQIAAYLNLDQEAAGQLRAAQALSRGLSRQERQANAWRTTPPLTATSAAPGHPTRTLAELPRAPVGRQQLFEALLTFLGALPAPLPPHDRLVLTAQGGDMAAGDLPLQRAWRQALQRTLAAGWTIEHYVRLTDEPGHASGLAAELLALFDAHGRYRPCYATATGPLQPPYDLLIGPPAVGAVLMLATEQRHHNDAALLLQHPGQVAQLRRYVQQVMATARPVAQVLTDADREDYWRALTEIEERPGRRWQIKEGLSILTRPPAWYAADAAWWRGEGRDYTAASAALGRRRIDAFERHLDPRYGGYLHRDIVPQRALDTYVATGRHPADLRHDGRVQSDTPPERLAHLERLLTLLRSEQYELALVRDPQLLLAPDVIWEVKEHQAALLQVFGDREGTKTGYLGYIVDAPTLVDGFAAAFEQQWRHLPFYERDQPTIRRVIEAKRDALRGIVG